MATKAEVLKAWNDLAGTKDAFELKEVESFDGVKQTQLFNKNGSLVVVANGESALKTLIERVGDHLIDEPAVIEGPVAPTEVDNKPYFKKGK